MSVTVRFLGVGSLLIGLFIVLGCATEIVPPVVQQNIEAQEELKHGRTAYQVGSYDDAIQVSLKLIEKDPDASFIDEAYWTLAKSYEAKGQFDLALKEYKRFRSTFSQSSHGDEALEKIRDLESKVPMSSERVSKQPDPSRNEYRIGNEDELDISVYGDEKLSKIQTVRPDGKIAYPFVGDLQATGSTPDELKAQITAGLSQLFRNPRVTVIVTKQTGKPVYLLGEVKKPGYLRLKLQASLLEAISQAEGLTETADLRGALLIREGQVLPVSFEKLLRRGDFSQNINLQPQDMVFIPNISYRKVLVLGEVKSPQAVPLKPGMTLMEVIAQAGGFTKDAVPKHILVLRGGLGDPQALNVNADEITKPGGAPQNLLLQPNDIVYVPKTILVDVERYVDIVTKLAQTFFFAQFGVSNILQNSGVIPVPR